MTNMTLKKYLVSLGASDVRSGKEANQQFYK